MKAIRVHRFGGPSQLRWEEIPAPTPGSEEVLVKVAYTSVNALDVKLRSGQMHGYMDLAFPFIVGSDLAGTVVAIGSRISKYNVGDRVVGMSTSAVGTYAEFVTMKESELSHLPGTVGFREAGSLPTAALTAWQGLMEISKLGAGQQVLVHGAAGGVGSMAVQIAKLTKCEVITTAKGEAIEFVKSLGADRVIDYTREAFETSVEDMDVVFDVVGRETRSRSWGTLRRGGYLVTTVPPFPTDEEAGAFHVYGKGFGVRPDSYQLTHILSLLVEGQLKPTVDRVFALQDAADAHAAFAEGGVKGKIMLAVGE